ncbi:MAG: TIGR02757 family protein [Nitrospirae bacterium]|nr:MAG: TIGR02757 family protein [Nitrospirota bacterium]
MREIKRLLNRFYREYNFRERMPQDPIEFPHRYKNPEDIEIAGFIASCFAYGRVGLFKPVIGRILAIMGGSPHDFLLDFKIKRQGKLFSGINYRFNKNKDIVCLIYIISELFRTHKSIENTFALFYTEDDIDTGHGLTGFIDYILKIDTSGVYGRDIKPVGFLQFFPSPEKGSACKRMNLFLRWMIRDKDIDFGIWRSIPKNKLVIPLDTHIARISRCLGFTERKANDWKTAVEITESLKKLDAQDPLKYDFAMCHHGIAGLCGTKPSGENAGCKRCIFNQGSRIN